MTVRFKCVACGGYNNGNHKCDPVRIARIEAARKGHEDYRDYAKAYGTRLGDGFYIMRGAAEYE